MIWKLFKIIRRPHSSIQYNIMINDIYNNELKNAQLMHPCNNFNTGGLALPPGSWGEDSTESMCCKAWPDQVSFVS